MTIHDLKRPFTSFDLLLEVITLSLLIKSIILITEHYSGLPDQIAIHYAFSGDVNGFGNKKLIWIMPTVGFAIAGVLTLLSRRPEKLRYPVTLTAENFQRQYSNLIRLMRFLKLAVSGIVVWLTYQTIDNAKRDQPYLNPFMIILIFIAIITVIAIFVYRSYRLR